MPSRPSAGIPNPFSFLTSRMLVVFAVVGFSLLFLGAASASAAVRFAAPGGTGADPCQNAANPCPLFRAADATVPGTTIKAGDEVVLRSGEYLDLAGDLGPTRSINLPAGVAMHGPGISPLQVTITQSGTEELRGAIVVQPGDVVSDLEVSAAGARGIDMRGGTVQRVRVTTSKENSIACNQLVGGLIRDSICQTTGKGGIALGVNSRDESKAVVNITSRLRNVTAISTGAESFGISYRFLGSAENFHPNYLVDALAIIARGTRTDVLAAAGTVSGALNSGSIVRILLDHSNFTTTKTEFDPATSSLAEVVLVGRDNISPPPLFGADGFHQLANSPTIDAGGTDEFSGAVDFDGQLRTIGARADAGADEFAPSANARLICAPTFVEEEQAAVCTMTVSDIEANPTPPKGRIEFESNGVGSFSGGGSCTLAPATANASSCQVVYTPAVNSKGAHRITARARAGDHASATGTAFVTVTGVRPTTTSSVTCVPGSVNAGGTSTCVITVVNDAPGPNPSGPVRFKSDGEGEFGTNATCILEVKGTDESACQVTYAPRGTGPASQEVTGSYEGDETHGPSAGSFSLKIKSKAEEEEEARAPTTTAVSCRNAFGVGRAATCTAIVTDVSGAPTTPAGKVSLASDESGEFSAGGVCDLSPRGGGQAGCQVQYTPTAIGSGTHTITASYEGDGVHRLSQGSTVVKVGVKRFAAPGGTGADPCANPADPCSLSVAADKTVPGSSVKAGDEIIVAPGTYTDAAGDFGSSKVIRLPEQVTIHGATGQPRPVLELAASAGQAGVFVEEGDLVSDLELNSSVAVVILHVNGGIVEGVVARSSFNGAIVCNQSGGIIRDSACLSSGVGASAIGLNLSGGASFSASLRNVTAISTGSGSFGLNYRLRGNEGVHPTLNLDAKSVIARGVATDVVAAGTSTPGSPGPAGITSLTLDHSDYATTQTITDEGGGPTASVTPAGSGTNIVAPAQLGADNIHQLLGSPTIDAGATDEQSGANDIDGGPRTAGLGADIGADEFDFDPTTTTLACQPNPLVLGNTTNCVATVTDTAAAPRTPTGRVDFLHDRGGEFTPQTCNLAPAGPDTASCEVSYEADEVGTHLLTASYLGGDSHDGSEGTDQLVVVTAIVRNHTATGLKCQTFGPGSINESSCVVTVSDTAESDRTTPIGTIDLSTDSDGFFFPQPECTLRAVDADSASCEFSYVAGDPGSGEHAITATFPGDAGHDGSSATTSVSVAPEVPARNRTATGLSCAPTEVVIGEHTLCTVTVIDLGANPSVPTGNLHFASDHGGNFRRGAQCTLVATGSDRAACKMPYTPSDETAAADRIFATYSGDAAHRRSQGFASIEILHETGDQTGVALSCDPDTVEIGQASTCTVTVTDLDVPDSLVSGEVTFQSESFGDFSANSCTLAPNPDQSSSSCQIDYTPAANGGREHVITASYEGAEGHRRRQGEATIKVATGETTPTFTTVSCDPGVLSPPESTTCTATVEDTGGSDAITPGGEVEFSVEFLRDGSSGGFDHTSCTLEPVANVDGHASCQVVYTPDGPITAGAGTHRIKGTYPGDAFHTGSAGSDDVVAINPTKTSVSCEPGSVVVGEATTCTASVEDISDEATPVEGKVSFSTDSDGQFTPAASCTLAFKAGEGTSCQVTYTPRGVGSGSHRVTASYDGDVEHASSPGSTQVSVAQGEEEQEEEAGKSPTTTRINCDPELVPVATATICSIEIRDDAGDPTAVTGVVKLNSNGKGAFSPARECSLEPVAPDEGFCQVKFIPTEVGKEGSQTITARYTGESTHRRSQGSDPITVLPTTGDEEEEGGEAAKAPTVAALSCQPAQVAAKAKSTCTATVTDVSADGATTPTGQVAFRSDNQGAFSADPAVCSLQETTPGAASCQLGYVPGVEGAHEIVADYGGDDAHRIAQEAFLINATAEEDQGEVAHDTTTALVCQPTTLNQNQSANCLVTVKDIAAQDPSSPAGEVKFSTDSAEGAFSAASCTLDPAAAGAATCSVDYEATARGLHNLKANYQGTPAHNASEGIDSVTVKTQAEEEAENAHDTATDLSCLPSSLNLNGIANCVATVKDISASGAKAPSGEVKFSSDAKGAFSGGAVCTLVAAGPDSAACAVQYTAEERGLHNLKANYQATTAHNASEGNDSVTVKTQAEEEAENPGGDDAHDTTTALSCLPSSLNLEGIANCVATVKDISANDAKAPSGEVKFSTDAKGAFSGEAVCSLIPIGPDSAACAVQYTAEERGPHNIKAAYQATTAHNASEGNDSVTVKTQAEEEDENPGGEEAHDTITSLSCLPSSLNLNGVANCEATVKDITAANATAPTGLVELSSDAEGTFPGDATCTLVSTGADTAACALPYTAEERGLHNLNAAFQGNAANNPSEGNDSVTVKTQAEEEAENPGGDDAHDTTTALSCLPSSLDLNGIADCVATVKDISASGANAPNGEVKFSSDGKGALSGEAVCSLISTGPDSAACAVQYTAEERGPHNLKAAYQATTAHNASEGTDSVTVKTQAEEEAEEPGEDEVPHDTTTSLSCLPATLNLNGIANCVATVNDTAAADATAPSGLVELSSDAKGAFPGDATCTLVSNGPASASCALAYTAEARGLHNLKANYQGTPAHNASEGIDSVTVKTQAEEEAEGPHDTTTSLSCLPATLNLEGIANCVATVNDIAAAGATAPSGLVELSSDAEGSFPGDATCTLVSTGADSAACALPYTAEERGLHNLKAAYEGNAAHNASEGNDSVTVKTQAEEEDENPGGGDGHGTTTSLSCLPDTLNLNGFSNCVATVKDTAAADATAPSGLVELSSDAEGSFPGDATCTLVSTGSDTAACALPYTAEARGLHNLKANYQGTPAHNASEGIDSVTVKTQAEEEAEGAHGTATSLSCLPATLNLNGVTNCVAIVTDIAAADATAPSGLVKFSNDAKGVFPGDATCTLVSNGPTSASCVLAYTAEERGLHILKANYQGTPAHNSSEGIDTVTVKTQAEEEAENGNPTTTALTCRPASVILGGGSVCTAVVTDTAAAGATRPSGEVEFQSSRLGDFSDGAICDLGPAGTNKARCQVVFTAREIGATDVTATYNGDPTHKGSPGKATVTATAKNGGHTATTAIACDPSDVILGGASVCSVEVTDVAANPVSPSGLVVFASNEAGDFGSGGCALFPTTPGHSRCQIIYTPTEVGSGAHKITALYSGDPAHEPSRSETVVNVHVKNGGHLTTTALSCNPAATTVGTGTKCTVTVSDTNANPVAPGKAVIFGSDSAGTFTPGGCTLVAGAGGKASCEVTYTPSQVDSGSHKITAVYEGDNGHEPSLGQTDVNVKAAAVIDPTATTLACAPASVLINTATTCTVTVTDTATPATSPTGAVKFASDSQGTFSNAAACALAAAGAGKASCQITYTPTVAGSGTHKLTAAYQGDATHKVSQGDAAVQVLTPPETIIKKHPRKKTALKVGRFTFASDQTPVSFECKLDRLAFRPCKAAFNTRTLKTKLVGKGKHKKRRFVFKLRRGPHVLQVRAKNAQGIVDPTPAVYRWRVGPVRHAKKHTRH